MASVFSLCSHCSQSFKEHSGKWSFIIKITLKWITERKSKIWRVSAAQNRKMLASHSQGWGTRNINGLINRNDFFSLRFKRFTLNLQRFKKVPLLWAYVGWRTLGRFHFYLILVWSEHVLWKSHKCHQWGGAVPTSNPNGISFWAPAFTFCFVLIRNITFYLGFFLQRQCMWYLLQFLEELPISPKREGKDLNNVLWHGVESCKEVEFHAFCSKGTYGNRVSSEGLSIVSAFIDISGI